MIERDLANVTDLALFRPQRLGPSQDESGTPVTLASGLCAIVQPEQVFFKDTGGREQFIRATIWIDPVDNDGDAIDVRAGDHLQYTDFRGVLQKRQLILRVSSWYMSAELDHIELGVG